MATDLAGYYESRPVITRLMVRRASRKANLSADDRQYLDQALRNHVAVVGQTLDDLDSDSDAAKTAKLGDGTLLKLLIDNLPAIIAAIKEIIGMFPKAAPKAMAAVTISAVSHEVILATGERLTIESDRVQTGDGLLHLFSGADYVAVFPVHALVGVVKRTAASAVSTQTDLEADGVASASAEQSVFGNSVSAGDAAFAVPPQLLVFIEPLAMAIAKAVWAYIQPQIDEFLRTRRGE